MRKVEYTVKNEAGNTFRTSSYKEATAQGCKILKVDLIPVKDSDEIEANEELTAFWERHKMKKRA